VTTLASVRRCFHADWKKWKERNLLINGIDFGAFGSDSFNERNAAALGDSVPPGTPTGAPILEV